MIPLNLTWQAYRETRNVTLACHPLIWHVIPKSGMTALKSGTLFWIVYEIQVILFYFAVDLNSTILSNFGNDSYLQTLKNYLLPVLPRARSYWLTCWHAAVDGWDVDAVFHRHCDNKGQTVTIVRVGPHIFGGYTDVSWSTSKCKRAFHYIIDLQYRIHRSTLNP